MFRREQQPEPVPVYTLPTLPDKAYTIVGLVNVKCTQYLKQDRHLGVVEEAGKAAAEMGADAVLGFSYTSVGWDSTSMYGIGTAVKFN